MDILEINHTNIDFLKNKLLFIYKLWIITNSKNNTAIVWNLNGNSICIDITLLSTYLENSSKSIFLCKTVSDFISNLKKYDFSKCKDILLKKTECNVIKDNLMKKNEHSNENYKIIYFENSNFQKDRFDLLKNLVKKFNTNQDKNPNDQVDTEGDPAHKTIHKIEFSTKTKLYLTLKQIKCSNILQGQVFSSNSGIIHIPANIFKNSSESVSGFDEKFEYAGFYGNCLKLTELQNIFGNYLPVYLEANANMSPIQDTELENRRVETVKESIDNSRNSTNTSFLNEFMEVDNSDVNMLEYKISPENLKKATPLEPIFNENSIEIETDNDVCMDLYLKFNNNDQSTRATIIDETNVNSFYNNNNELSVDKKSEDDSFKSFSNQYSDSINVLLQE